VKVKVLVGVSVTVGVLVKVLVNPPGFVLVKVGVKVDVGVKVKVGVFVKVFVFVKVKVLVGVREKVKVLVKVKVEVPVSVAVGVGVDWVKLGEIGTEMSRVQLKDNPKKTAKKAIWIFHLELNFTGYLRVVFPAQGTKLSSETDFYNKSLSFRCQAFFRLKKAIGDTFGRIPQLLGFGKGQSFLDKP
jgi:hypothetical protein